MPVEDRVPIAGRLIEDFMLEQLLRKRLAQVGALLEQFLLEDQPSEPFGPANLRVRLEGLQGVAAPAGRASDPRLRVSRPRP
eukprot:15480270-Alexandrium_andersonii.AAC.1